jgi:chemotaxis protein methyltransferase CheR
MNEDLYTPISTRAFRHIQEMFRTESGISLSPAKQALVASRLRKRLEHHQLEDFDDYCRLLSSPEEHVERRIVIDLLTTNETYFFREPDHFKYLGDKVLPNLTTRPLRVWCAASSSGEEPYSLAMTVADKSGTNNWEVIATDLSTRVLEHARRGVYDMQRMQHMPEGYLKRFCLKGTGDYAGFMQISRPIREQVSFVEHNLLNVPTGFGKFDVVFMRNVLIYFDNEMKQKIVANALEALPSGGWFYTSHSESLSGLTLPLQQVSPSIYRKK